MLGAGLGPRHQNAVVWQLPGDRLHHGRGPAAAHRVGAGELGVPVGTGIAVRADDVALAGAGAGVGVADEGRPALWVAAAAPAAVRGGLGVGAQRRILRERTAQAEHVDRVGPRFNRVRVRVVGGQRREPGLGRVLAHDDEPGQLGPALAELELRRRGVAVAVGDVAFDQQHHRGRMVRPGTVGRVEHYVSRKLDEALHRGRGRANFVDVIASRGGVERRAEAKVDGAGRSYRDPGGRRADVHRTDQA